MLNRTAGNGHFTCPVRTVRAVDQDVCSRRRLGAHIAFDVATGDVNVADVAGSRHDAAPAIIADVAAGYVRLVQVDVVVKNTDAAVLVQVTVGNNQVAVVAGQMDAVQDATDVNPRNRQLHSPDGLDTDRFRMAAFDCDCVHERHALSLPDVLCESIRIGRLEVRADKLQGGTRPVHNDSRNSPAAERCIANLVKIDHNWFCDTVHALS